jgi:predicted transglutaminase-like cysteine proteinase
MWGAVHVRRRGRLCVVARRLTLSGTVLALAGELASANPQRPNWPQLHSIPISIHGSARPIAGWIEFCRRVPTECDVRSDEATTITLTDEVWNLIVTTNKGVNATIEPLTDEAHWGLADRWDLAEDGHGDCEDYQLLKRKLLAEKGLPRRAMRMTVVLDDYLEGHAVLMIRTDLGDFVLDNRTSFVLPWTETGYLFLTREGDDAQTWVSLGGVGSPRATAVR